MKNVKILKLVEEVEDKEWPERFLKGIDIMNHVETLAYKEEHQKASEEFLNVIDKG